MDVLLLPFRWVYRGVVWLANSPRTLILSYGILIVICGVLYHHFEDGSSIGDSVWWAIVTASTVGYGDISPETWQARVLAGLLISIMVLLVIPLITAHFASRLIVDADAFRHEEQEELKLNLRRVRALLEALADREGITVPGGADLPPAAGSASRPSASGTAGPPSAPGSAGPPSAPGSAGLPDTPGNASPRDV